MVAPDEEGREEHADRGAHARAARLLLGSNLRRLRRGLSEIEAGKRNVSIDNIGVLAHALGVGIGRLFEQS